MSVQEIEQAIMSLSNDEVRELQRWLADYRAADKSRSVLDLAGTISAADLKIMVTVIQDDGERIELEQLVMPFLLDTNIVIAILLMRKRYTTATAAPLTLLGKPIPDNDIWIAASAIQMSLVLVTRDSHFQNVPGLSTVAW